MGVTRLLAVLLIGFRLSQLLARLRQGRLQLGDNPLAGHRTALLTRATPLELHPAGIQPGPIRRNDRFTRRECRGHGTGLGQAVRRIHTAKQLPQAPGRAHSGTQARGRHRLAALAVHERNLALTQLVHGLLADLGPALDHDGLQHRPQDRLHGRLPTSFNAQVMNQPRGLGQPLTGQPVTDRPGLVEGALLQGLKRGQTRLLAIELGTQRLHALVRFGQRGSLRLEPFTNGLIALALLGQPLVDGGERLVKLGELVAGRLNTEALGLIAQALTPRSELIRAALQLLNARALDLRVAGLLRRRLAETLPLPAPLVQRLLLALQLLARRVLAFASLRHLGFELGQALA